MSTQGVGGWNQYHAKDGDTQFLESQAPEAGALAQASKAAFDGDIHYGAPGPGGPPGYDSAGWQKRMMQQADYYKIVVDTLIVGGIIVFRKQVREYELGRIFVTPEYQNMGIGTRAFDFLWATYPLAKRWTLGTPGWNQRTQHFYKKVGFQEVGRDGHGGVLFEQWRPSPSGL